jgi:hypothetical protein
MSSGCIPWPRSKRRHFQGRLTIALAAGVLSLGGETAFGQSSRPQIEPRWTLCIRVDDPAQVSPGMLATALTMAGRVLLAAGVPTEWHTGSRGPVNPEGRSCLTLSVTRGVSRKAYPGALGVALPHAHTGADITIFYDRIERLEWHAVSANATAPQILGYAMAHEIGHVLLGSTQHSLTGIMKGPWGEAEFERLAKGWLGFTAQQGELMRESAFRRAVASGPRQQWKTCTDETSFEDARLSQFLCTPPCAGDKCLRPLDTLAQFVISLSCKRFQLLH